MTEIIKFDNEEYQWEDIPDKGKCLVPLKQITKLGDYWLHFGEGPKLKVILIHGIGKYTLMNCDTSETYMNSMFDTLIELQKYLSKNFSSFNIPEYIKCK